MLPLPTDIATDDPARSRRRDLVFLAATAVVYIAAALIIAHFHPPGPNRLMVVAQSVVHGHLDSPALAGTVDSVKIGDKFYLAVGFLQLVAYLPFALIPGADGIGALAASVMIGMAAAFLALPLVRAYGARGIRAYWVAAAIAFGSLLLLASSVGSLYQIAHVESFLALTLFLIEWAGRRRPWLLGLLIGLSFLARATTIFAAVPFGLYLLWRGRNRIATAISFGLPIAASLAVFCWFNWIRFGSALESGYGISTITAGLEPFRAQGLFAPVHILQNLQLGLLSGFGPNDHAPYFMASRDGLSMLFVSPILLASVWAGFRDEQARLLWLATLLVAVPVLMYYGGGMNQYGFRYSLDFTPFLFALVAMGSSRWLGRVEPVLVVLSMASLGYGIVWWATRLNI